MPASVETGSARSRKRRRSPVVCTECRRRKSACDRKLPCAQCTQHGLDCAYQNDGPASQRPAPGLFHRSLGSTNICPEHSRIPNAVSENTAAIVPAPLVEATTLGGPTEGALNDAVLPISGTILTPPVTASSSISGTLNQDGASSQPQNRVWVNFDGTFVPNGHSSSARDHDRSDHKGRYLKSRLVGQSH